MSASPSTATTTPETRVAHTTPRAREQARRAEPILSEEATRAALAGQRSVVRIAREDSESSFFAEETSGMDWESPPDSLPAQPPADEDRPMLRLYGTPQPEAVPVEVPSEYAQLPVMPVTAANSVPLIPVEPVPLAPMPAPAPQDTAAAPYRSALRALQERRFQEALSGFQEVSRSGSPYALRSLYWAAEVQYIQRDYSSAAETFARFLAGQRGDSRAAEALHKLALCQDHLGQRGEAGLTRARLQREFPNSVAARTAAGEQG